ncbi:glutathione S-transferase family protein [Pokkaliibacter sp. CJK22405]|uniref:glutathione S-transferase family protein n=1 Tax=Pokkaliibacter sp. CJK22405 TaxID=3384615 RepID=UPI0039848F4E
MSALLHAPLRLVIGDKTYSSWSLRAWYFMTMSNISFEEVPLSLSSESFAAEIQKYSGAGKVPVLLHDQSVIWDSLAICEYASETFLDGRGWPAVPQQRAWARSVVAEMHSSFSSLRQEMPMDCSLAHPSFCPSTLVREDIRRIESLWHDCRKAHRSEGPWLFGRFSIADAMFAPVASRFRSYGVSLDALGDDYMQTLLESEGMQRWYAQAKAEMQSRQGLQATAANVF